MMNLLHLCWIVPVSTAFGFTLAALCQTSARADRAVTVNTDCGALRCPGADEEACDGCRERIAREVATLAKTGSIHA